MKYDRKYIFILAVVASIVTLCGYSASQSLFHIRTTHTDQFPAHTTLSGTYVCLPRLDTSIDASGDCVFGLRTDDGVYYAVNFGQSAQAMKDFQSKAHIQAEGFIVDKETLSTNQWDKYSMKGIFTITRIQRVSTTTREMARPPFDN